MRLVVLVISVQGIEPKRLQSPAKSPIPSSCCRLLLQNPAPFDLPYPVRAHERVPDAWSPAVLRRASGANSTTSWFPATRRIPDVISPVPVRPFPSFPCSTWSSSAMDVYVPDLRPGCFQKLTCPLLDTTQASSPVMGLSP
ncbi:uncharacterized protein LOC124647462 [Lolium rigidum]|uniref:uncharacterized protein LOC124647462 n=1 Tax=Lolium rigidum TaxID=89674 RepID=UPI001F5C2673|nr:uncharacterized protein LOC124647462 [Lolium rigidum]